MSITATSATGSGIDFVLETGDPPPMATRFPILMPLVVERRALDDAGDLHEVVVFLLDQFHEVALAGEAEGLRAHDRPALGVGLPRVGHRQDAAFEAARDHELDRIVRDLGAFLTSLLVAAAPTSNTSTSVFMMFSEGQAYSTIPCESRILEGAEATEFRRFTNGETERTETKRRRHQLSSTDSPAAGRARRGRVSRPRERRRPARGMRSAGSGLAPRVARRRGCVRTTDANTRGASGARVCRPDAPTRCRPAVGTRAPVVRMRPTAFSVSSSLTSFLRL